MSDGFIKPDFEELSQAGLVEDSQVEAEQVPPFSQAEPALAADFRRRWQALLEMPAARVLERVERDFGDKPQQARELLSLWLAQELGYRRLLRRAHTPALQQKPFWDILQPEVFAGLSAEARRAVEWVAHSTRPQRRAFHPMAALAALALWRHGDRAEQERAQQLLGEFALPDDPDWLYLLVGELGAGETDDPRGLYALGRLQLAAKFWDSVAFMAGLYLVHAYAPARAGSPIHKLLKACDRAADEKPREVRPWLELMADATLGGQLNYSWLEKPMRAAIRLSIDASEREQQLRQWHDQRPYEADYARLADLYAAGLAALHDKDADTRAQAHRALLEEVEQTVKSHPIRAQRLLELMTLREHSRRLPASLGARLDYALEQVADKEQLSAADEMLVRLYVSNYNIEPHALRLVRRTRERIMWQDEARAPGPQALEIYLMISDYERAFEHLTCKFDGVILDHADKDAAARVKYFVEKRLDPNHLTRLVRRLFTPLDWIGASLGHFEFISTMVARALGVVDRRIQESDLSQRVLAEYREAGIALERFEDVARLNMGQVDATLRDRRTMRILLGAVAGGLSGGLAPFGWAALSLADAPVLLALSADICSRFCWYYGFDPRAHPELPLEIMAVALGGSRAEAIEPMLLRQNLNEYAIRKSLIVGALAHGSVTQMGARTLGRFMQGQLSPQFNTLARQAVARNFRRRAAEAVPSRTLPIVGALLGASLNVALIHDVCEAAQAVLTDRFLERKYPDWSRKFDPEAHGAPDISLD